MSTISSIAKTDKEENQTEVFQRKLVILISDLDTKGTSFSKTTFSFVPKVLTLIEVITGKEAIY